METAEKVFILKEIAKRKDILFGAFSPIVTKEAKHKNWNEILELILANGVKWNASKSNEYSRHRMAKF
jgi:hypothetical protein